MALVNLKEPSKVEVHGRHIRDGEPRILDVAVSRLVPLHQINPAVPSDQMSREVDALFGSENEGEVGPISLNLDVGNAEPNSNDVGADVRVFRVIEPMANSKISRGKRIMSDTPLEISQSSRRVKKPRGGDAVVSTPIVLGKSTSNLQDLLNRSMLKCEYGVDPLPYVPFVSSSMSEMLERDVDAPTRGSTRSQMPFVGPIERFVISSGSSSSSSDYDTEVSSFVRSPVLAPSASTVAVQPIDLVSPTAQRKKKKAYANLMRIYLIRF